MKTENKKSESGAVGQPGESTTTKAATLTSEGISSLLNSEFAKDTAETPGKETPPAAETETEHLTAEHEQADKPVEEQTGEEAPTEDEAETQRLEAKATELGKTIEEVQAMEAEEAAQALPPEMQTALDDWEAKGGALPDSLQRVVNKRIGRLTGEKEAEKTRADRAEAELKTVQAEAEALRNDPNRPAVAFPGAIVDEAQLAVQERAAKKFLNDAEAYLDDAASEEEKARVERFMASNGLDANGLKRRVREVNALLRDELPVQRQQVAQFRSQEKEYSAQAVQHFPWLKDKGAPEQAVAKEILRLMPDLPKRLPNHQLVMGIYMLGYKAFEAQLAKAQGKPGSQTPATKAKTPPPKTPAGHGGQVGVRGKVKPGEAASEAFNKAPTRENAVELARAALMGD